MDNDKDLAEAEVADSEEDFNETLIGKDYPDLTTNNVENHKYKYRFHYYKEVVGEMTFTAVYPGTVYTGDTSSSESTESSVIGIFDLDEIRHEGDDAYKQLVFKTKFMDIFVSN